VAYRIAHIADVHLDMAFLSHGSDGGRRRKELQDSFERALRVARERNVDALCIAGDLYEDGRAGPDRAQYLHRVLGALHPIRVFLAPGNHDPLTPSSVYRQMQPLPGNVVVFDRRAFGRVQLTDDVALWGFGHQHPADRDPAIGNLRCDGAGTHLLLFHGSDRDAMPPGKEAVAPFSGDEIVRAGAVHAMVGHFHGMLRGKRHAYPGSLEPHNFAQDGRHTMSFVTVDGGRVDVEFVDANRVRYADLAVDVSPYADRSALAAAIAERLASLGADAEHLYARVRLAGVALPSLDVDLVFLGDALQPRFGDVEFVEDHVAFDFDAVLDEGRTVRSEFVREMRKRIDGAAGDDRALLERALSYGMLAFAGRTIPE